jgi:adenine-specific DNA-methyltransferase
MAVSNRLSGTLYLEWALSTKAAEIKRHGKHYTPTRLARFLAERILVHVPDEAHLRVLDPACGDGELLFAIYEIAQAQMPSAVLSLTGYDLDPQAVRVAEERARALEIPAVFHNEDFLSPNHKIPNSSLDIIITNPPYVRTQQLGQDIAQMLAVEYGLEGRIDLTHPFVTISSSLLRPGGVMGLLCSNRFLTTKAGTNIRKVMQTALHPVELYDLGDTKLFGAAVLPAIAIATKLDPSAGQKQSCSFVSAYEVSNETIDSAVDLYEALVSKVDKVIEADGKFIKIKAGALIHGASPADPWRISHKLGDDWLQGIKEATWATFGDIAKIRVGIKTTADSVFISDVWDAEKIKPESEVLLPLVTHHNVTPWRISNHLSTKVLYPYDLTNYKRTLLDMNQLPLSLAYLETHAERLKGRKYVVEGGREWFEIWVPQRPILWASPKIVFPDISETPRFAYDRTGAVVNGDCYWISMHDIQNEDLAYLMLAVANSRLGIRYYDEVCGNKLYSGRRRWITQYVSRFPLPDPKTETSQKLISAVKSMLEDTNVPNGKEIAYINSLVEQAFDTPIFNEEDKVTTLF